MNHLLRLTRRLGATVTITFDGAGPGLSRSACGSSGPGWPSCQHYPRTDTGTGMSMPAYTPADPLRTDYNYGL